MKKRFFSLTASAALLFSLIILNSCKKSLDTVAHVPAAGLLTFNLAIDKAVGVSISGNNLLNFPLYYTNFTGAYQGVYTGTREITSYDFDTQVTLANTSAFFQDSAFYSLFVVGANGTYKNVFVKDNLDSLPVNTGQAFVRYINAIPDSAITPSVSITANGTSLFNDTPSFTTVSAFKGINPGNISVTINNGEDAVNATRSIALEQNKVYTLLLTGLPGETDTSKAVQIKYIINGTVTP